MASEVSGPVAMTVTPSGETQSASRSSTVICGQERIFSVIYAENFSRFQRKVHLMHHCIFMESNAYILKG